VSDGAKGSVKSTFFSVPPLMTGTELSSHLGRWIEAGAVPLLTLNLFLQGRDAWHHQVVRGVDEKGKVMLLNPIERVEPQQLIPLLSSPSFKIIPKEHMQRKLSEIITEEGGEALGKIDRLCQELDTTAPWSKFAVGTQISQVFESLLRKREEGRYQPFNDVIIPFGGLAGVTLFYQSTSRAAELIHYLPSPQSVVLPAYEGAIALVYNSLAPPEPNRVDA